jgi:hypothetical protein
MLARLAERVVSRLEQSGYEPGRSWASACLAFQTPLEAFALQLSVALET